MFKSTSLSVLVEKLKVRHVILCAWVLVAILYDNRSLLIGTVFLGLMYFIRTKINEFSKTKIYLIAGVFFLFSILLAFFHKADSTYGRVLIYKVSGRMFCDSGFLGVGFGNFKALYTPYQAQYFKTTSSLFNRETNLADNTYYLFNDYLQVILELGIFGWLINILFWITVVRAIKYFFAHQINVVEELSLVILLPIIIGALFNHFFERIWVQCLFLLVFPQIIQLRFKKNILPKYTLFTSYLCFFVLFGILHCEKIRFYSSNRKLKEAKLLASCGYSIESLKLLNTVQEDFKQVAVYNRIYGKLLYQTAHYKEALPYLLSTNKELPSSDLSTLIGCCYRYLNKYNEALLYFKEAISMTPNRFIPRNELLSTYINLKEFELAKAVALEIARLPIKVPSQQIFDIKTNANQFLTINQISIK
ncbi:O-antigen ligase family protein [Pedobacter sp. MW01-1-1]|uniref:O-antigen ligase family protein n=1 Tax=Pedobacter sp. MW01-1-1 TaxID=3383027 RepID=UPI003FEDD66C